MQLLDAYQTLKNQSDNEETRLIHESIKKIRQIRAISIGSSQTQQIDDQSVKLIAPFNRFPPSDDIDALDELSHPLSFQSAIDYSKLVNIASSRWDEVMYNSSMRSDDTSGSIVNLRQHQLSNLTLRLVLVVFIVQLFAAVLGAVYLAHNIFD